HGRNHGPECCALRRIGAADAGALQAIHQGGGTIADSGKKTAIATRHRVCCRNVVARQVIHDVHEKRQLPCRHCFEQRQYPAALRGVDEIVRVGNAGADFVKRDEFADGIVRQQCVQVGRVNTGVDGHQLPCVRCLSARLRNTVISFAAWLSPRAVATSMPRSKASMAACVRPLAASALPYSFQAAEYCGSCATACARCSAAPAGSSSLSSNSPSEKRSKALSLPVASMASSCCLMLLPSTVALIGARTPVRILPVA